MKISNDFKISMFTTSVVASLIIGMGASIGIGKVIASQHQEINSLKNRQPYVNGIKLKDDDAIDLEILGSQLAITQYSRFYSLKQLALKTGIIISSDEITKAIEIEIKSYGSREKWLAHLKTMDTTELERRTQTHQQLLINKLIQNLITKIELPNSSTKALKDKLIYIVKIVPLSTAEKVTAQLSSIKTKEQFNTYWTDNKGSAVAISEQDSNYTAISKYSIGTVLQLPLHVGTDICVAYLDSTQVQTIQFQTDNLKSQEASKQLEQLIQDQIKTYKFELK